MLEWEHISFWAKQAEVFLSGLVFLFILICQEVQFHRKVTFYFIWFILWKEQLWPLPDCWEMSSKVIVLQSVKNLQITFCHIIIENKNCFLAKCSAESRILASDCTWKVVFWREECVLFLFYYFNIYLHFPETLRSPAKMVSSLWNGFYERQCVFCSSQILKRESVQHL